jgi:hypothetical protein
MINALETRGFRCCTPTLVHPVLAWPLAMWDFPFENACVDADLHRTVEVDHSFELAVIFSGRLRVGDRGSVCEDTVRQHAALVEVTRRWGRVRPVRLIERVALRGLKPSDRRPAVEYPRIPAGWPPSSSVKPQVQRYM